MTDHWTNALFVDDPGLYVRHLQIRESVAEQEVNTLKVLLSELGYELPGLNLIDLGCGIGRHSRILAEHGARVLGLDISHSFISMAKNEAEQQGLKTASFQVCDMRDLKEYFPMDKGLYDGIVCLFSSFGYYDDQTNEKILESCHYLVKPGGFLALDIMNKQWIEDVALENKNLLRESTFWKNIYYRDARLYMTIIDRQRYQKKEFGIDVRLWDVNELLDLLNRAGWHLGIVILAKSLATALEPVSNQECRRIVAIMQKLR